MLPNICHPFEEEKVIDSANGSAKSLTIDPTCGNRVLERNSPKPEIAKLHSKSRVNLDLRKKEGTH